MPGIFPMLSRVLDARLLNTTFDFLLDEAEEALHKTRKHYSSFLPCSMHW